MEKVMIKRLLSVCFVAIIVFGIFSCAQTAEDSFVAETETVEPENTAVENEEDRNIEAEEAADTADAASKSAGTAVESSDVLREIDEYRNHFIGLYTSNALSDEFLDMESGMIIEEHNLPRDNGEDVSVTVYSDISGKLLRYKLHYYVETGNIVINYYLCDNFVWVCRQNNHYSSFTLRAGYSDVLYSTIENWIIIDEAVYILHDNGELEETDKAQLENEIAMLQEIKAMEMGYSQANTIADIRNITWEAVDYNVVDLHFHLEDGSAVDKKIIAYSVRDIVYKDITGDDADEVLIYCDFANNMCDWQLIYFYQINQGNVTDISPSSKDIPELDNADRGIWNMWWIAAETMEGYSSPIYELEDYYKEKGIVNVKETLYIGYRDDKWELVRGFDKQLDSDISKGQGSIKEIGENEYRITLYDKNHNEVFSEEYSYMLIPPWFTMISDNIWEIGISIGSPARYTFYFDTETAEISDTYFNAKVFGDKYIAYMDSDVIGADKITLTLTDIFKKGILHQEIVRDFSICADPMSAVYSIEMINDSSVRLEYCKGEDYTIVSETIALEWTSVF